SVRISGHLFFFYKTSPLRLSGKFPLLFFDSALCCFLAALFAVSWQRSLLFFLQRSPPFKPGPLSLPISPAGQRWTPALPVCLIRACTGKFCRPLRASGAVSIYRLRGRAFTAVRFRFNQILRKYSNLSHFLESPLKSRFLH
ncbi:MAG: hypothetical protein PHF48_08815, partial [Bacteroidales bacterium]|nr:hypothetical protein [Bacteroidales bacterium]